MSTLEEQENRLRELNEYLDKKQNEVVLRAETLIKEQNSYLKSCVSVNVQKMEESEKDLGIDSVDFESFFENKEEGSDFVERMSTGSTTDVLCEDPSPRRAQPMPISITQPPSETPTLLSDKTRETASVSTFSNNEEVVSNSDANVFAEENFSTKAALRLQKARFKSLNKKHDSLLEKYNSKEKETNRCHAKIKELEMKLKVAEKKNLGEQQRWEKQRRTIAELEEENNQLRLEVGSVKRDLDDAKKCLGKNQRNSRTSDVRLSRALEDAEKYRRMLQRVKNDSKTNVDVQRGEMNRLQEKNRQLTKQKCELLNAFRKQVKLIDILKKQKAHLEAMKLLEFTEEQFVKTLEIGEKLVK